MEDAVDDGTVEFLVVGSVEGFGISLHRVETDKQVAGDLIAARIIERDDICIIIMLEVLAVYFQNLLVGAEDVADIADLLPYVAATSFTQLPTALFLIAGSLVSSA